MDLSVRLRIHYDGLSFTGKNPNTVLQPLPAKNQALGPSLYAFAGLEDVMPSYFQTVPVFRCVSRKAAKDF